MGHGSHRYGGQTQPNACHNIRAIYTNNTGLEETYDRSTTRYDHSGNKMLVFVDVFGSFVTEPNVTYRYTTLNVVETQNIISDNGIRDGIRYWYYYQDFNTGIKSGDIII
jgi:hypothetical protein